jgi:hypothetical protein
VARTLVWLLVGSTLIRLVLYIEDNLKQKLSEKAFLFATLIIALSLLFEWVHVWVNERIDRIAFSHLHLASDRLQRTGAAMIVATSAAGVDRLLIEEPIEALRLTSAAVFRRDDDGVYRQHVRGAGWPVDSVCEIPNDAPLVPQLMIGYGHLRLNSVAVSTLNGPTGIAQPVVAIPVRNQVALSAIVLYGLHRTGDDLDAIEIDTLVKLCLFASAAYQQLLNDELRKQVLELKTKLAKRELRRRSITPEA